MHREVRKAEEIAVGNGEALGDDRVVSINYKTVTFVGVEMCAVHCVTKKKGRDKVDGRIGDVESIVEEQNAVRDVKFNGAHAGGVNGLATNALDGVGLYGTHGFEIVNKGRDVACSSCIDDEGEAGTNTGGGHGCYGKGRRDRIDECVRKGGRSGGRDVRKGEADAMGKIRGIV